MNDKQGDSLVAAIEGNFAGMSHGDLVLTCEMLTRGRAAWRTEAEKSAAELEALQKEVEELKQQATNMTPECGKRIDEKRSEIDSLRTAVAELQKDKERLDWGEKNFARVALGTPQLVGEKWTIFGPSDDGSDDVEGNTLREAIDAAISAEKQ